MSVAAAPMSEPTVYLDYAATTPVDPAVQEVMARCLATAWANPSSSHGPGRRAAAALAAARADVAACLGCCADEILFTAGATEAVNLAIQGVARAAADRGRHVVTTRIEHSASLGACEALERQGFVVTRLNPARDGSIAPAAVAEALRPDTVLVSLTHVNSELGTVLDLPAMAGLCQERGVPLHVDAAQSAGKLPIDLAALPGVSLLSLSAHKCYGPKGVGALFARRRPARVVLTPLVQGGGQEQGLRAGTPATHQIAGLAAALRRACEGQAAEQARLAPLRDRLQDAILALGDVWVNGDPSRRVAGHLNVSIGGVDGESLVLALPLLAVSRGSACSSLSGEPSYVLRALGRDDRLAGASLRLTLGRPTRREDIDRAAAWIAAAVQRLRALSPGAADADAPRAAPASAADGRRQAVRLAGQGSWEEPPAPAPRPGAAPASAGATVPGAGEGELGGVGLGYSPRVLELFATTPGAGRVGGKGPGTVWRGRAGGRGQDAEVEFSLRVVDGTVAEARFLAAGCPHTIAAAAHVTGMLAGAPVTAARCDPHAVAAALGVPAHKLGRLLVVEDALDACLSRDGAGA